MALAPVSVDDLLQVGDLRLRRVAAVAAGAVDGDVAPAARCRTARRAACRRPCRAGRGSRSPRWRPTPRTAAPATCSSSWRGRRRRGARRGRARPCRRRTARPSSSRMGQVVSSTSGWPAARPSAPSRDRTRTRKSFRSSQQLDRRDRHRRGQERAAEDRRRERVVETRREAVIGVRVTGRGSAATPAAAAPICMNRLRVVPCRIRPPLHPTRATIRARRGRTASEPLVAADVDEEESAVCHRSGRDRERGPCRSSGSTPARRRCAGCRWCRRRATSAACAPTSHPIGAAPCSSCASASLWPLTNQPPSGERAMSPPGCGKVSGAPSVATTRRSSTS